MMNVNKNKRNKQRNNNEDLLSPESLGPTSTTKALLVSILAPRVVSTSKKDTENEEEVENGIAQGEQLPAAQDTETITATDAATAQTTTQPSSSNVNTLDDVSSNSTRTTATTSATTTAVSITSSIAGRVKEAVLGTRKQSQSSDADGTSSIGGDSATPSLLSNRKDELAPLLTEDPGSTAGGPAVASDEEDNKKTGETGESSAFKSEEVLQAATDVTEENENILLDKDKMHEEPLKTDEKDIEKEEEGEPEPEKEKTEEEEEITPEEMAAVVVVDESKPDDAEVNMEELLRIAFRSLLEDMHLLTYPTFTLVQRSSNVLRTDPDLFRTDSDAKKDDKDPSQADKDYEKDANDDDQALDVLLQVQVMVRPISLPMVLDRMERIGIGINCGSLSVFRAELCRTTNPYAIGLLKAQQQKKAEQEAAAAADGTNKSIMSGMRSRANSVSSENIVEATTLTNAVKKASSSGDGGDPASGAATATGDESVKASTVVVANVDPSKAKERMIEAARLEWKNAATRLRIEQVREQISEQAAFSFDFVSLLGVASILAAVGLITDNTVVIVASMLVSPIMGPVLGLTFGSRIKDWDLVRSSLWHETLALGGCVLIGGLVGLGAAFAPFAVETWPTNEMEIRGEPVGLVTGIAIAIPSGMGVCLSILGGNTSSLVGVAISASLLPPAVNAGICFIFSFLLGVGAVGPTDVGKDATDFAVIGSISFALTALNILCIWISGIVMFEIKEVAPQKRKNAFWARDIKVARELNSATTKDDKPPPVDISVLRDGIKSALEKKQNDPNSSMHPGEQVKFTWWGATTATPKPVAASGSTAQPPTVIPAVPASRRLIRQHTLEETFALQAAPEPLTSPAAVQRKAARGEGRATEGFGALLGSLWAGFNATSSISDDGVDDVNAAEGDVRYVGLEDMAALLGFDAEDEDYYDIDPAAVVANIGNGRYI